jgi:hypothetical protein
MRRLFNAQRFTPDLKKEVAIKTKKVAKPIKKVTGEGILFKAIWTTRKHKSFVSGEDLGSDGYPYHFAHVLPKGKYPDFRLLDRNIVLLTREEHTEWDQGIRSTLRTMKEWNKMFELEEQLKQEYKLKKLSTL